MTRTPLWRDRHPVGAARTARLEGPWDVVVVGAGLTGLTTGLLLARAGREVLVVEARHVGAGTTGGSTAKVSLLQGTTLSRMASRRPQAVVRQYVEGNREALAWVDRYAAEHGVEVQKRTAYTYATSGAGEESARAELRAANAAGLDAAWTSTPELPFRTRGAVALPDQSQLDPLALLDALSADLEAHGGTLVEGVRVTGSRGSSPVRLDTTHGSVEADAVVVATNLPVLDRGGFFARAVPQRSYAVAFPMPAARMEGMYLSADSPTRSLRQAPGPDGELLLVGGNGHTTGRRRGTRACIDDLVAWSRAELGAGDPTHTWSAQDYVTAGGTPWAGPLLPGRDDLLTAGGYAKWGMTNGVAAALVLSARLLEGQVPWGAAYDPWQVPGVTAAATGLGWNAEVGLEMARGWLAPVRHGAGSASADGEVRYERLGRPVASCRTGGEIRRLSAVCPHLGGVVRWNDAERSWDCPLHGSRFDEDGRLLEGPATRGLARVRGDGEPEEVVGEV
jgi:glycine/D-amino acid oxidase-like deaminating enzyme/nitrite reductase/ring-hydroxylating ferredoxin subunit